METLTIPEDELRELQAAQARRKRLNTLLNQQPDEGLLRRFRANVIRITVGDLRDIIEENPDHPSAQAYMKAYKKYKRHGTDLKHSIVIEKEDLQGLLENRVVRRIGDINDPGLYFKTVDERLDGTKPVIVIGTTPETKTQRTLF